MSIPGETALVELASLERASETDLWAQAAKFARLEVLDAALTALLVPVMVVNAYRQIVYANQAMADLVDVENGAALVGIRPGEALHCHHVEEGEGGCGTSPFCRYCGAARAIAEAQAGATRREESFIVRESGQLPIALDMQVTAKPFSLDEESFTMLTIADISNEKRRHAMERIFFHDILNTVQKMRIAVDLLGEEDGADATLLRRVIQKSVERLTEEIQAQRDLTDMENGALTVKPIEVRARELLVDLIESYLDHGLARDLQLRLAPDTQDVVFVVDQIKLRRVLDNMIKNALEAEAPGATVTVGCHLLDAGSEATPVGAAKWNSGFTTPVRCLRLCAGKFSSAPLRPRARGGVWAPIA